MTKARLSRPLQAVNDLRNAAAIPSMNVLRIASAVKAGETITIGTTVFEIKSAGQVITAGRVAVDLTASPTAAAASLVLTFAANASNADTVTINGQVYTIKTALTASTTANEVLLGADLTATRNNLVAAITGGAGAGTTYGSLTVVNTAVTATPSSTNALTATAKVKGTAGNAIAVAEAGAQIAWAGGAVALAGGVDPTAAEAVPAIVAAINSTTSGMSASTPGSNEVFLWAANGGATAYACTETLAGSNNVFAAAAAFGGRARNAGLPINVSQERVVTATEVALAAVRFVFGFNPLFATAKVITTAGVAKTWDGATTISENIVTVDASGSSDYAAGDKVVLTAGR